MVECISGPLMRLQERAKQREGRQTIEDILCAGVCVCVCVCVCACVCVDSFVSSSYMYI